MSIKKGFHYDDYNRRYYRDENGDRIPDDICLCAAKEPGECSCDCTSWSNYIYEDLDQDYLDQLEWEEHREETWEGIVSKPCGTLIELITCESGDWEILKVNGLIVEARHSIDWPEVIKFLGYDFKEECLTDELMEELYN